MKKMKKLKFVDVASAYNNRRSMGRENEAAFRHPVKDKTLADAVRINMGHSFSIVLDKFRNDIVRV